MKILSIDVGIKNLAYCLFDVFDKEFIIKDWNIVNLCGEKHKCNCKIKNEICNKNAKYTINDNYYCAIHAKKTEYLIPCHEILNYKKLNSKQLLDFCSKHKISNYELNKNKILERIKYYLNNNLLTEVKNISANDMSLIDIGISIVEKLDMIDNLKNIDLIIIENQISPIANKMKCIQGMLAQYFIMRDMKNVKFISSTNKLKKYIDKLKTTYSERKKLGITITNDILEKLNIVEWKTFFNSKKSKCDDLADCFLQGLWYLEKNNLITEI